MLPRRREAARSGQALASHPTRNPFGPGNRVPDPESVGKGISPQPPASSK